MYSYCAPDFTSFGTLLEKQIQDIKYLNGNIVPGIGTENHYSYYHVWLNLSLKLLTQHMLPNDYEAGSVVGFRCNL